jgi:ferritin-like metal-binding protein YciE
MVIIVIEETYLRRNSSCCHYSKLLSWNGFPKTKIEELCEKLSRSSSGEKTIDPQNVKSIAAETEQKASQMMQTYLGNDADASEALEFLCIAEGGEVTHYEVLDAMVKDVKDTEFADKVKSILNEEKEHLQECIQLARQNIH